MKNFRSLKNLSNRCMVAVMTAAMIMSSAVVSPIPVYANEQEAIELGEGTVNGETQIARNEVAKGEELEENTGTVITNNGTIVYNEGTVNNNSETGTVKNNMGTVVNNYGTVENLTECEDMYGQVTYNYATVTGSGSVTNNYGGNVAEGVTVTNNFFSVTLEDNDQVTTEYGNGFVTNDTVNYIKENGQAGTLTFAPKNEGYQVTGTEGNNYEGTSGNATYKYSVTNNTNGICSVALSCLTGNISLNMESLGLMLSEIKQKPAEEQKQEPEDEQETPEDKEKENAVEIAVGYSTSARNEQAFAIAPAQGYGLSPEQKALVNTTYEEANALFSGVSIDTSDVLYGPNSPDNIIMAKTDILMNSEVKAALAKRGLVGRIACSQMLASANGTSGRKKVTLSSQNLIAGQKVVILYYLPGDPTPHLAYPRWKNGKLEVTLPVQCTYNIVV